jgi:hypothetical protein
MLKTYQFPPDNRPFPEDQRARRMFLYAHSRNIPLACAAAHYKVPLRDLLRQYFEIKKWDGVTRTRNGRLIIQSIRTTPEGYTLEVSQIYWRPICMAVYDALWPLIDPTEARVDNIVTLDRDSTSFMQLQVMLRPLEKRPAGTRYDGARGLWLDRRWNNHVSNADDSLGDVAAIAADAVTRIKREL